MAQTTQVRQIRISVDTKGNRDIKALADQLGGVNGSLKRVTSSLSGFRNIFLGTFAGIGVRELAGISDSMQSLNDRIKILSGGSEQAKAVFEGLLKNANDTKSSIEGLATTYARLAASTTDTKIETSSLLELTKLIQNTFRLSGTSVAEAANASIQLSQAFASGQLRGDELRSVMEQNVEIGGILSKTFKVTRGEIYAMAKAGELTSGKVMKALFDNMGDVNSRAEKLGQTFEQTLTVAMNKFKFKVNEINQEFNVSGKFAKGMDVAIEKSSLFGTILVGLAVTQIPYLVAKIGVAVKAITAFALSNPWTAALTGIGFLILAVADNLDELKRAFAEIAAAGVDLVRFTALIGKDFSEIFLQFVTGKKASVEFFDTTIAYTKELSAALKANPSLMPTDGLKEVQDFMKAEEAREKLLKNLGKGGGKEDKLKKILSEINKKYLEGKINAEEYYNELNKFENLKMFREFRDGKIDLEKYNEGLKKIREKDLNQAFAKGTIGLREFNAAIEQNKLNDLKMQLDAGKIGIQEYDREVTKISTKLDKNGLIRTGTQDYLDYIGTTASQISDAISGTFKNLEDKFIEFTKTGKFNFADFAQAILDDLNRIIFRATIIKPLADAVLGSFGTPSAGTSVGGSYTNVSTIAAKGAAFDSGVKKFAKGGLVGSPTLFNYGGGKTGLMGEAGTEAIMPLTRTSNGDLGVQATTPPVMVNIINNAGAQIEQQETTGANGERVLEVTIIGKVKDAMAQGQFDKIMGQQYGLRRRGS